jgi:hypothetical protein
MHPECLECERTNNLCKETHSATPFNLLAALRGLAPLHETFCLPGHFFTPYRGWVSNVDVPTFTMSLVEFCLVTLSIF